MRAWRLEKLGGRLGLEDIPVPEPRPGSVLVKVEASALMSYLKAYVEGKLSFYSPPAEPFTIGTNAIGAIEAVGRDVWTLKPGRRVVISSHFRARENVDDPPEALIGLTAGAGAASMLADWPDGTLADYALAPAEAVTPLDGPRASSSQLPRLNLRAHGETPIFYAARLKRLKTLDVLIEAGADPTIADIRGRDTVDIARARRLPRSVIERLDALGRRTTFERQSS